MIACTRWRSQFGKYLGSFSSLRAGRIKVRPSPGLAKNASVCSPAKPLSVAMTAPGPGAWAGWGSSMERNPSLLPETTWRPFAVTGTAFSLWLYHRRRGSGNQRCR